MTVKLTDSVLREVRFFTSKTVRGQNGKKARVWQLRYFTGFLTEKGGRRKAAEERKVRKIFRGGAAKWGKKIFLNNLPPKNQIEFRFGEIPRFQKSGGKWHVQIFFDSLCTELITNQHIISLLSHSLVIYVNLQIIKNQSI